MPDWLLDSGAMILYFSLFGWNSLLASLLALGWQTAVLYYKYRLRVQAGDQDPPKKLSFPKYFDAMQLGMFAILTGCTSTGGYTSTINLWNNFLFTASFALVGVISCVCRRPFIEQYARDQMPEQVSDMVTPYATLYVMHADLLLHSFGECQQYENSF
jgi:uncharacterized membrane protein